MKALCGAWAVSGGPVGDLLPPHDRAAILAAAGGGPGSSEELLSGPLWMASAKGKLASAGSACGGMEGFLAAGAGLGALVEGFGRDPGLEPRFAGHYVLALADLSRKRLTLLRDLSGNEQLYFSRAGDLLLFSSSVKPLLAHPAVGREADPGTLLDHALMGVPLFGDATLFKGIRQVLPGHRVDVSGESLDHRWHWERSFEPLRGDIGTLGRELREAFPESARAALGADREAAVSLSGGLDSACVAAALVDVLGPERVHAFTYELEGSPFPSETPLAALTCRRLGIRRHTVKRIGRAEHLDAVPEALWLMESPSNWKMGSIELLMARLIASHGFARYFSGCGSGGSSSYLQEVAESWLAAPGLMRRYWRFIFRHHRVRRLSGHLPPSLDMTFFRSVLQHIPALCILRDGGFMDGSRDLCPEPLAGLAEGLFASARVQEDLTRTRTWPLGARLHFHHYANLYSYDDRGRRAKVSRLAGASKVSTYLLPGLWPFGNLPLSRRARPVFWHDKRLRPVNLIQRAAFEDRLPGEVVFRRKNFLEAAPPVALMDPGGLGDLKPGIEASMRFLEPMFGGAWEELRRRYGLSLAPLALWHSLLVERRPGPSWEPAPGKR